MDKVFGLSFSCKKKLDNCWIRATKIQNFSVGRILRAKTFWTDALSQSAKIVFATKIRQKCVNKICNINVPKVQTWDVYHGTYSKKLLTLSGNFLRLSGYFPDCPETFQTVQKLFRMSRNFPDSLVHSKTYSLLCWCLGFILWSIL